MQETGQETGYSRYIYRKELDKVYLQRLWLMETLKIYIEEQLLIKYYTIRHLILPKIQDKYQREFASMFASKGQQLILKTNN